MTGTIFAVLLATLTVWDYPLRQNRHDQLRRQYLAAAQQTDLETMVETCRKGVVLLPEDPVWHYNLACAQSRRHETAEALAELEKAVEYGFRDADAIVRDADLAELRVQSRFLELVNYARAMAARPVANGPFAFACTSTTAGKTLDLGAENLIWDLEKACFRANVELKGLTTGGNWGDFYMNRDGGHSRIDPAKYPGLTSVRYDADAVKNGADRCYPTTVFPYPVFGNASLAFVKGPYWRSIPRSLMTTEAWRMKTMQELYLANQIWVFPAMSDIAPIGTLGDVFASVSPYWFATAGRSWSDIPYLAGALEVSRSLPPNTKAEAIRRKLLAPTIQMLVRRSLKGVVTEEDYLSPKAHPTAMPAGGLEMERLKAAAAALKPAAIPPLAAVSIRVDAPKDVPTWPELTYATSFATAFVLRAADTNRVFELVATTGEEHTFAVVHGAGPHVKLEKTGEHSVRVSIDRTGMSVTNRIDVAAFARNAGTSWGAPSFVSFAVVDPEAPYSDPILTPRGDKKP